MFGRNAENHNTVAVVNPKLRQLQDLYSDAVRDCLGCFSKIDGDGDIVFKYGALGTILIRCDAEDLGYFRLIDLLSLGTETAETEMKALKAINETAEIKCAKQRLLTINSQCVLENSIEAFFASSGEAPSRDIIYATLERYAEILSVARHKFLAAFKNSGGMN